MVSLDIDTSMIESNIIIKYIGINLTRAIDAVVSIESGDDSSAEESEESSRDK